MKPVTLFLGSVLVIGAAGAWTWQNKPELVTPVLGAVAAKVPALAPYLPAAPTRTAAAGAPPKGEAAGAAGRRGNNGAPVSVVTASVDQQDFAIRRRSIGYIEPLATVVVP